jgi:hypothetical protein
VNVIMNRWVSYNAGKWRPIGLWDVKDPTLSRQSAHRWRTRRTLPSRNDIIFLFLILISVTGWVNPRAQCGRKIYRIFSNLIRTLFTVSEG